MVKELKTNEFENIISTGDVVIKVFTKTCVPCKMVAPVYEELSEKYPNMGFYSVDAEEEWELNSKLNVASVPTIIAFKDGVEQRRGGGMMGLEKIEAILKGDLG